MRLTEVSKLHKYLATVIISGCLSIFFIGCKKLVEIPPPVNTITTEQAFSTEEQATSAIASIYYKMINGGSTPVFGNGGVTIYTGMSSDEFKAFNQSLTTNTQFQNNTLSPLNSVSQGFWSLAYNFIYTANAIIDGLHTSNTIRDSVKNELINQAKFVRAFCNFYLVNLYGDIPLITTTNWHNTALLNRSPIAEVFTSMVLDLQDAKNGLSDNFSLGKGERIVPNKWAAIALLSRVNLYLGKYNEAESEATLLINNSGLFNLSASLDVFSVSNKEAIWQLKQDNAGGFFRNAVPEGGLIIPANRTSPPLLITLTSQLLNSFQTGDKRRSAWVDSTIYTNTIYYYPYKYKISRNQMVLDGPMSQYYTILRLAEQYLIRAEARAKQGNLNGAIADLNVIRNRAGLPLLPGSLNQQQVIAAIEQENRIEFFAEWGHRWFDLKRWGRADAVLGPIKGSNWQTTDLLYPIPQNELITDPNLTQNPGY